MYINKSIYFVNIPSACSTEDNSFHISDRCSKPAVNVDT